MDTPSTRSTVGVLFALMVKGKKGDKRKERIEEDVKLLVSN